MTLRETLSRLLEAAHRFEAKTPKYRRIESERQALRDVMTDAQLVLSVQEQPKQTPKRARRTLQPVSRSTSKRTAK